MRPLTRHRSLFAVLAIASSLLLGLGTPAAGQTPPSDPYGSTVPPTVPPQDPTCLLAGTEVEAGTTVEGTLSGLEAGAEIEVVLGALGLGTVVADEDGTATFSFPLPEGATGVLAAVGVTFTVECGLDVDLDGEVDVLGGSTDRPPTEGGGGGAGGGGTGGGGTGGGGAGGGSEVLGSGVDRPAASAGGSGSGSLARTGATLLPLVALGLVALAVGAHLRRRSRARRFAV